MVSKEFILRFYSGGGIQKYQNPNQGIEKKIVNLTPENASEYGWNFNRDGRNSYFRYDNGKFFYYDTPIIGNTVQDSDINGGSEVTDPAQIQKYRKQLGHVLATTPSGKQHYYIPGENGMYTKEGDTSGALFGKYNNTFYSNLGAGDATWNANKGTFERDGWTYKVDNEGKVSWVLNSQNAKEESQGNSASSSTLPYNTFVKYNLGSKQARRNFVNEHADYLRQNGFDPTNYTFTAKQNYDLARLMPGAFEQQTQVVPSQEELSNSYNMQPIAPIDNRPITLKPTIGQVKENSLLANPNFDVDPINSKIIQNIESGNGGFQDTTAQPTLHTVRNVSYYTNADGTYDYSRNPGLTGNMLKNAWRRQNQIDYRKAKKSLDRNSSSYNAARDALRYTRQRKNFEAKSNAIEYDLGRRKYLNSPSTNINNDNLNVAWNYGNSSYKEGGVLNRTQWYH